MVTKQQLEKKVERYKKELKELSAKEESGRSQFRVYRKRLKRTQRKLALMAQREDKKSSGK